MKRLSTNKIVIHHTAGNQSWTKQETMRIIHNQHGVSPYHIVIGKDWETIARDIRDVGWHAGNWLVNLTSVAICLNGNFTKDTPTDYQKERLAAWINYFYRQYSLQRRHVFLHKEVRIPANSTLCPGFGHEFIDKALGKPVIERVNEALRECGDDPTRSVGTLTLSKWWQNRVARDPDKFTNDDAGYQALVGAIKWHQANHKYPHD